MIEPLKNIVHDNYESKGSTDDIKLAIGVELPIPNARDFFGNFRDYNGKQIIAHITEMQPPETLERIDGSAIEALVFLGLRKILVANWLSAAKYENGEILVYLVTFRGPLGESKKSLRYLKGDLAIDCLGEHGDCVDLFLANSLI